MTGPQSRSQSAQPLNVTVFVDFRLAASACVVIPIAAQTTTVVAIIRVTVMLSPLVGHTAGGLTSKTGKIYVATPKKLHLTQGPTKLCRSHGPPLGLDSHLQGWDRGLRAPICHF